MNEVLGYLMVIPGASVRRLRHTPDPLGNATLPCRCSKRVLIVDDLLDDVEWLVFVIVMRRVGMLKPGDTDRYRSPSPETGQTAKFARPRPGRW